MKLKTKVLAACIASVCAASAFAQSGSPNNPGFYVGGSVGQSKLKSGGFPGQDTSDTGGKIYGGYEFTPNLAVELGYVDFGSWGPGKGNGEFVDVVGKFPIAKGFSALARGGAFRGEYDNGLSTSTGTSYKFGGGVQYDLNANVGLRAEYERYKFDVTGSPKSDLLSVGVNYKF